MAFRPDPPRGAKRAPRAAGGAARAVLGELGRKVKAQGFAPKAVDFNDQDWAWRGHVLAKLAAAELEADLTGAEARILKLVSLKLLGMSTAPEGRLSAATMAAALKITGQTVRRALRRLHEAELLAVTYSSEGEAVGFLVHPRIAKPAGAHPAGRNKNVEAAPPRGFPNLSVVEVTYSPTDKSSLPAAPAKSNGEQLGEKKTAPAKAPACPPCEGCGHSKLAHLHPAMHTPAPCTNPRCRCPGFTLHAAPWAPARAAPA